MPREGVFRKLDWEKTRIRVKEELRFEDDIALFSDAENPQNNTPLRLSNEILEVVGEYTKHPGQIVNADPKHRKERRRRKTAGCILGKHYEVIVAVAQLWL